MTFRLIAVLALCLASAAASAQPKRVETAIFAGGCFWCMESDFDKVPGVISTTSGYTGGHVAHPTYEDVSSGTTGDAESVEVKFDPGVVSYRKLVDFYWHSIDPTTKDRQFCDVGTQYRTAIFYLDEEQKRIAEASLAEIEKTKPFKAPIVTQIVKANEFWPAEEYHQDYYKKNPVRYEFYRQGCGRDARVKQLWGSAANKP